MLVRGLERGNVDGPIFGWEIFLSLFENDALGGEVVLLWWGGVEGCVCILGLKILNEDDGSKVMGDGRVEERLRKRDIESFKNVLEIWLN